MDTLLQIKCLFKKICCNMALVMISSYFAFLVEGNATPDEIDMLWVSEHVSVGYFQIANSMPCLPPSPPPPHPSPSNFCISYWFQVLLGIFSLKTVVNAKLMNSSDRWMVSHCSSRKLYQTETRCEMFVAREHFGLGVRGPGNEPSWKDYPKWYRG